MIAMERLFAMLFLIIWVAVISLPGVGITYLGWRFSRNMKPGIARTALRAGLIALTITPSFWGHGGILPAIVLALVLHGRERLVGIIPILVMWVVMIPIISVREVYRVNE